MNNMNSLTLNGKTYDSFIDKTAREQLANAVKSVNNITPDENGNVTVPTTDIVETPEMYFDITDDGIVSLKPEYRGACPSDTVQYGVSDNGKNVAGSKNSELPEDIVIPEVVNEIAVTALPAAMFAYNENVKSITIPYFISEIPYAFARQAINLHTIKGTRNVKKIDGQAFYATRLKKAKFPSLESFDGTSQFRYCTHLVYADLGTTITSIPKTAFDCCVRLSCVHGAEGVTTVGESTFCRTRRLKNLNFLPNVTQIDSRGFCCSRVEYDWSTLTNCTFGANATVSQYNPTNFWSTCTYTACNTPLRSVFAQTDPQWAADTICNTAHTYGANGCGPVCEAIVYSTLENRDISSPKEFVDVVRAANSSLMDLDPSLLSSWKSWLETVGYTVTYKSTYNAENLQAMFDALAAGSLVISIADSNDPANVGLGHCVVIHGINENGEVLVLDPDPMGIKVGDYTCAPFAMHVQKFIAATAGFLIVTKN